MIGTAARDHVTPPARGHAPVAQLRVLVADPQPLYRDAVARVVRQRAPLVLAGEHADGRSARAAIRSERPDVAILDTDLPGLPGRRVVAAVARDGLPTRVLLLCADVRPDDAYAALAAGAAGVLSKAATAEELVEAVLRAADGEVVIGAAAQSGVAREIRLRAVDERPAFTPREREVLERVAHGRSAPEIAAELQLGVAKIKTHLSHVFDKLEVSDRAAAVAEGMRRGLLE